MWLRTLILIFLTLHPKAALAEEPRPAELPPPDFSGTQYIDSKGCVFLKQGRHWSARRDPDNAVICGFPPSLSAWASVNASKPSTDLSAIEREMTMAVVTSGNATTILAPKAHMPGSRSQTNRGEHADINGRIAEQMDIYANLTHGPKIKFDPNERICDLLGLKTAGKETVGIISDPTGGYCSGYPSNPAYVYQYGQRVSKTSHAVPSTPIHENMASTGITRNDTKKGIMVEESTINPKTIMHGIIITENEADIVRNRHATKVGTVSGSIEKPDIRPRKISQSGKTDHNGENQSEEYIPATAQYVQIGRFNAEGSEIAIRALTKLGYPVVREKIVGKDGKRFIMAGPFATRERLVAGLNQLRKSGFKSAVAR